MFDKYVLISNSNLWQETEAGKQIQTNNWRQNLYVKYGIVNATSSIIHSFFLSLVDSRVLTCVEKKIINLWLSSSKYVVVR